LESDSYSNGGDQSVKNTANFGEEDALKLSTTSIAMSTTCESFFWPMQLKPYQ